MLTRRVTLLQQCSCLKNIYSRKSAKAKLNPTELAFPEKPKLPIPKPKVPKRDPFVKGFFFGKFDSELLTYPEPQTDVRHRDFNEWLKPIEEYVKTVDVRKVYESHSFSEEMREKLRELGIYGGRIPYDYDGVDLLNSEYLKLVETLSIVPKVGMNFLECNNFAVDLLVKEGTVEQKHQYLRKIASGHYYPAICVNENEQKLDPEKVQSLAILSQDEKTWCLKGQKYFVQQDNNANLFIVYAASRVGGNQRHNKECISAFIVDKNTPGVGELIPVKSPWLGTSNLFSVKFKDVNIPYENIIGKVGDGLNSLEKYYTSELNFSAGVQISILKSFLNSLINHAIRTGIHERDSVKQLIAKTGESLYAMESVAYLTASLADLYEDPDLVVERAITRDFCTRESMSRLMDGFRLTDAHLFSSALPFEQIMRNQMFEMQGNSDLKTYIGLLGIQYSGIYLANYVKKHRNPFNYPAFALKKLFGIVNIFPKRDWHENLHPCFKNQIFYLEQAFGTMEKSSQTLLGRHGLEILTREADIQRLSEMASLIYAVTAVYGRASRSYCIGLANTDLEVTASIVFGYKVFLRIEQLGKEIEHGDILNGNIYNCQITDRFYDMKRYCLDHPLERNW